ncbi:plasmid maintenance system killer protein [Rhabdobacter roseus]|uniref:Plasmid maintenance system killer protein n=1 Tax=Rhabdobacter roseus TaxID=1655419 RepID=A0A840TMU0_9BACT|nr:plasmid maintenance system killer protein [Rhabdobacter roseus]
MIINYRHKGLELYATKGDRSKLQQKHVERIKLILTRLNAATSVQMMN